MLNSLPGIDLPPGAGTATYADGTIQVNLGDGAKLRLPRVLSAPVAMLAPLSPLVQLLTPLALPAALMAGGAYRKLETFSSFYVHEVFSVQHGRLFSSL